MAKPSTLNKNKNQWILIFICIGVLLLEGREAVLHRRRIRVKQLVVQPLLAPPLLVGVQVGARVRLLLRLRLGVEVLVCPALAHDAACGWREELAVLALDLGRLLVTVQPLARLLDLLGGLAFLEALARLDGHEVCMRLHLVRGDRERLESLLCSLLVLACELLVEGLFRGHLSLVLDHKRVPASALYENGDVDLQCLSNQEGVL